jgi:hypothetical protein
VNVVKNETEVKKKQKLGIKLLLLSSQSKVPQCIEESLPSPTIAAKAGHAKSVTISIFCLKY